MADEKADFDGEPGGGEGGGTSTALAKAIASAGNDKQKILKVIKDRMISMQNDLIAGKLKPRQKNDYLLELIEVATKYVQRSISEILPLNPLFQSLRLLCVDKEKIIRSQAFRTLRKLVCDSDTVVAMVS
jgi:hypothetical protein